MYVIFTSTYYESNNAERAWKTLFSLQRSRTVIALLIRISFFLQYKPGSFQADGSYCSYGNC